MNEEPETDYKPMTEIVAEGDSLVDVADLLADDPKALAEYVRALAKQFADLRDEIATIPAIRAARRKRTEGEAIARLVSISRLGADERNAALRSMSHSERSKYFQLGAEVVLASMATLTKHEREQWLGLVPQALHDRVRLMDFTPPERVRLMARPGFGYTPPRRTISRETYNAFVKSGLGSWVSDEGVKCYARPITVPQIMERATFDVLVSAGDPVGELIANGSIIATSLDDAENAEHQLRVWADQRSAVQWVEPTVGAW